MARVAVAPDLHRRAEEVKLMALARKSDGGGSPGGTGRRLFWLAWKANGNDTVGREFGRAAE